MMAASTSSSNCVNNLIVPLFPMKEAASNNSHPPYPAPLAKYDEVISNPKLFMITLEKLHASMATKFMIPIIGGKELDLCRLFIEVTSRGGLEKVVRERRWKEITSVFNFPSTATNASFVLRKYYSSLLYHYEQIYYFKANRWNPTADALLGESTVPVPAHQRTQLLQPPSPAVGAATITFQQPRVKNNAAELLHGGALMPVSLAGTPVVGVIDGKFESGYLVTVTMGSEILKGVLFEAVSQVAATLPPHQTNMVVNNNNNNASTPPSLGVQRRRRRKKSEIKRRDPAHPKPNRSGYNFFFAEQHARLKPLHQAKDRDISRMIGELWNQLKEPEKSVYQEKAIKDKERYKAEMEDYREKLKMNHVFISDAVPLQQRLPPEADSSSFVDVDMKLDENRVGSSHETPDESSSGGSDYDDDTEAIMENDMMNMDTSPREGMSAAEATTSYNMDSEKSSKEGGYELLQQAGQKIDQNKNMLTLL